MACSVLCTIIFSDQSLSLSTAEISLSCLLFGIVKLIVLVPRGLCFDGDLRCEILPSISLGHVIQIL